jgi:hypothetical protein
MADFKRVVDSGDAHRMCRAFAMDGGEIQEFCEIDEGILSESSLGSLNGLIYNAGEIFSLYQDSALFISGYHRNKTILKCEHKQINLIQDATIKYCTISGCDTLYVRSGTVATFIGVVFDGVTIVIEDGAIVHFQDVEISGSEDYGCKVEKGGKISSYEKVVFLDVLKNFYIEHADRESVGTVVDFDNSTKIVEFVESSIVPNISLYSDFVPAYPMIEFKQSVVFYNMNSTPLRFDVKKVNIEKNFKLVGEFITLGEYTVSEVSDISIGLSRFEGTLAMFDAIRIIMQDTRFEGEKGLLSLEDSFLTFMGCTFDGWRNKIETSGSQITFMGSLIKGAPESIVELKPSKYSTEEQVKVSEPLEAAVGIVECDIKGSSGFIDSQISLRLVISQTRIFSSSNLFNLNDSEILINEIMIRDSKDVFSMTKSSASIKQSKFYNGMSQFDITDKSDVTMEDLEFEKMGNWAFNMRDSRIIAKRVNILDSENGVSLLRGSGEFYHQDCLFNSIKHHNIIIGHGVVLINLNDHMRAKEIA